MVVEIGDEPTASGDDVETIRLRSEATALADLAIRDP